MYYIRPTYSNARLDHFRGGVSRTGVFPVESISIMATTRVDNIERGHSKR